MLSYTTLKIELGHHWKNMAKFAKNRSNWIRMGFIWRKWIKLMK